MLSGFFFSAAEPGGSAVTQAAGSGDGMELFSAAGVYACRTRCVGQYSWKRDLYFVNIRKRIHRMSQLTYLALMVLVAAPYLWKSRDRNLPLHRRQRSALLAMALVALPFVIWDVLATDAGHWRFSPEYTLQLRIVNLPLEEVLFFVVVPLTSILVWETTGYLMRRK
jgi:lycopene cyclase domain-containing protein